MTARNFTLSIVLVSAILYLLGVLIPPLEVFFEVLNALIVALSAGVAVGFARAAYSVSKVPPNEFQPGDVLVVGIFLVWSGILITFCYQWAYRLTDDPWYLTNSMGALGRWLIVIGGCFHLAASGAIDNRIPRRAYMRVGMAVAAALFVALIMISLGVGIHETGQGRPWFRVHSRCGADALPEPESGGATKRSTPPFGTPKWHLGSAMAPNMESCEVEMR